MRCYDRPVESRTIDIDGPVHYLAYDGPGEGPVFVLVHGLGGSHANWLSLAPGLSSYGRVLVPDVAGFGRTPLGRREATVHANRILIDRFVETTVRAPVILVGNSMGGYLSMRQAAMRPDSVAGLVLVDPAVARARVQAVDRRVAMMMAASMIPRAGERLITSRIQAMGPERWVEEALRLCAVDPSRIDPTVVEAHVALARERIGMPWATHAFLEASRSLVHALARRARFDATVQEISAPTLLLMGRRDRLVPVAAADALARLRPDWEYVVFDDLGHVPQLEDPGATLDAITAWLDGLETSKPPA